VIWAAKVLPGIELGRRTLVHMCAQRSSARGFVPSVWRTMITGLGGASPFVHEVALRFGDLAGVAGIDPGARPEAFLSSWKTSGSV